ncbi:MAG TPA: TolC family protein [Phycisphaerae bacterium]|nr:TolC family protein [Phycisphaerae bacterium]
MRRLSAGAASQARLAAAGSLLLFVLPGCQHLLDETDRQVYSLIERRQQQAIGLQSDARIARGDARIGAGRSGYAFVPDPADPQVPQDFTRRVTTQPTSRPTTYPTTTQGVTAASGPATTQADTTVEADEANVLRFELRDCLKYAFGHSREYQTAKEDLYLSALALTLERHLWTPTWVAKLDAEYDYVRDFDRSMQAVAEVAVTQRLPYGGEVTARVIDTLVRDVGNHVTTTENGRYSLEASVPLLRGAGRVAYESRYQAERDLTYAVRRFERFRREFAVSVASDYYNLLQRKQQIENTQKKADSNRDSFERDKALFDAGRATVLDVQRTKQEELVATNQVLVAGEAYQSLLDQFKITLGMPIARPLELTEAELDVPLPSVSEQRAIEVALGSRLDLFNTRDRIDDAKRQILVARNGLLPDLDLRGQVAAGTESDILDLTAFENSRISWQGGVTLNLPVERKEELNRYRSSLVSWRRAERQYQLAADQVSQEVRRALRQIQQAQVTLQIQQMGMELAENRRAYAEFAFREGLLSNRDVVEAENDLLNARNAYAAAQAGLRVAILSFRRDTGTLRTDEEGNFLDR